MQENLHGSDATTNPADVSATTSADNAATTATIKNTNRWDTKQLVVMALMCAISILLSFVEFAIFAPAPWLKYDASFVPCMVVGFAYGPGPGVAVGIISVALHGLLAGNFWGAVMNVLCICGFLIPAALIYKRKHTWPGAVIALVVGSLCAIVMAIIGNLLVTPIYAGMPVETVAGMIVPILIPFNIMKVILNSVITIVVYKVVSNLITPKKDQVKGK